MKKLILPLAILLTACGGQVEEPTAEHDDSVAVEVMNEAIIDNGIYGEEITVNNAITLAELPAQMEGKDSLITKIAGSILQTCPVKGCWMILQLNDSNSVRVMFKDYAFFVPTEGQEGKTAICEGYAYYDTTTVADLQHYAEDEGLSQEEVDAITEPEVELCFEATGVIIK